MVVVDTSVWIRFLANRAPYAAELDRLLALDEVAGHELVYGELLIGDRRGRVKLLSAYELIHQASRIPHDEVVEFVRSRQLHGRGAGWIDIHLLAAAVAERLQLWTADPRFLTLAADLRWHTTSLDANGRCFSLGTDSGRVRHRSRHSSYTALRDNANFLIAISITTLVQSQDI